MSDVGNMFAFVEAARQIVRSLVWSDSPLPSVSHAGSQLAWRHHGLGMLQAELSETLRIHVWHPALVSPHMAWPRCVHDHRFDFLSAVVVGAIRDVHPEIRQPDATPDSRLTGGWHRAKSYEIEHAKNQDRMVLEKGCSTATSARFLGDVIISRAYATTIYKAGDAYEMKRRVFHTTETTDAVAITVLHRANFDDRLARVLCAPDADVTAVSGIVRDESLDHQILVNSVLREAATAIANMAP
jgi:hypothetical protein